MTLLARSSGCATLGLWLGGRVGVAANLIGISVSIMRKLDGIRRMNAICVTMCTRRMGVYRCTPSLEDRGRGGRESD